jgi:multisubunit Na+/H+ antiporter MnhB subunit
MRLLVALLFLMLGVALPLPLNGQTFTNSLFGIVCALLALALGVLPARSKGSAGSRRRAGRIVAVLAGVLALFLLGQLPSAYRFQRGFNRAREQIRQVTPQGTIRQTNDRPEAEPARQSTDSKHGNEEE